MPDTIGLFLIQNFFCKDVVSNNCIILEFFEIGKLCISYSVMIGFIYIKLSSNFLA